MPSEAWGFRHGQDVEYKFEHRGKATWVRAKIVGIRGDMTLQVKLLGAAGDREAGFVLPVNNPKKIRARVPPSTLDDVERFLGGQT